LRLSLICVGRLGRAPEAALAQGYAERATAAGRSLALSPMDIIEVEGRKPGRAAEAEAILAKVAGATLIACDERGRAMTSRALAAQLATWRDEGVRRLAFAIGGADGLDLAVTGAAR
jgi:23S rRNA (pseudouridine1915-N3)-methyltransferase